MLADYLFKHKKVIIAALLVFFVLVVSISAYFVIMDKINSVEVNVIVTPTIANVKIGEKNYKPMGSYKIQPGKYDVEVSADGFITKTGKLTAVEDESIDIQIFLEPTEENVNWYDEHPEDALILGEIKNSFTVKALGELKEENPILKQLPLEIDYYTKNYAKRVKYTISYRLNGDNDGFVIIITDYTGGNYDDAVDKLTARGLDINDVMIEYKNESDDLNWGAAR